MVKCCSGVAVNLEVTPAVGLDPGEVGVPQDYVWFGGCNCPFLNLPL